MTSIAASLPDARESSRQLLVAIHDVTPALEHPVRELWSLCRTQGVIPSLLVVPNWHGEAPLAEYPGFIDWLRECQAQGAEIFVHGERHDERDLPRGWLDTWHALGKTAREGEFLTLDREAALARIARGVLLLRGLGLQPIGFVPPAWLAREACWAAVSDAGLRVSEDDQAVRIHLPSKVVRLPAPVVRWSSRTPIRALGSALVAGFRWQTQRTVSLMRVALHPSDLANPVTAQSATRALGRWVRDRSVVRYEDLMPNGTPGALDAEWLGLARGRTTNRAPT